MFQLNPEQQSAVENIVYAKNYPLPYILIGPPGESFELPELGGDFFSFNCTFSLFCYEKGRAKQERWLHPLSRSFS